MSGREEQLEFLKEFIGDDTFGVVERSLAAQGYETLLGVDEAGRGPLAGPVVAAAVCLPVDAGFDGLNDSKLLSARRREGLFPLIISNAIAYGVGFGMPELIDERNILAATKIAMLKAVALATSRGGTGDMLVIDGNQPLATMREQRTVVGGDRRSVAVAAASVVAKVLRDRWMGVASRRWPGYAFDVHKGYGTKKHLAALHRLGPCPIHRMSFKPVKRLLTEDR